MSHVLLANGMEKIVMNMNGSMSYLMAIFLIYCVGREVFETFYVIKHRKVYSKTPKEFKGPTWVLVFYFLHAIAYSIFGLLFWNYYQTTRMPSGYSINNLPYIIGWILVMTVVNLFRKRLDKIYVKETEVNET